MKVIIDRFEENIAVVELNGEMLHAPRALFAEAHEGDAVELTVLPRKSSDPVDHPASASADQADALRKATEQFFHADKSAPTSPEDEDPAAIFKKLRNKKKRR